MPFCYPVSRRLRQCICLLAALLVASALAAGTASAQELLLSNLVLNNFKGKIRVRFGVEPTGVDIIRQALLEGDRLALVCKARLAIKRDYVWNREVSQARFESEVSRLKGGDFVITLPGQGSMADRDLSALFRKAWNEILIDLGSWDRLERGQTYVLTLELSLTRLDVSPWVKKGLFFWPFDPATPVSYQLDFTY